jgi:serine/threonine-protein kinase
VRERLSGRTLRHVIKEEGRINAKRLVQFLTDAAEGLAAVHAARLYHGELSPESFEFDPEGRLKVAGLGITVRSSGEPGTPLMGNPRYVAPEILKSGAGGPPSDIYALGLIAWELLTSAIPHETETGSVMDLFKKRFLEPLPLPPVQGACSDLLRRMLQLDPRDRHADGAELLRDLSVC